MQYLRRANDYGPIALMSDLELTSFELSEMFSEMERKYVRVVQVIVHPTVKQEIRNFSFRAFENGKVWGASVKCDFRQLRHHVILVGQDGITSNIRQMFCTKEMSNDFSCTTCSVKLITES